MKSVLLRQRLLLLCAVFALSAMLYAAAIPALAITETPVEVPILMYHSILEEENGSIYCLSADHFREDMVYLQTHGYTAVFVQDLINYDLCGAPLPKKPVVVTLDDGYLNGLTAVLPILEDTDMKATISVVGSYCDMSEAANDPNPAYAYLTWADVQALSDSGYVEIGSHTWDMHELKPRKGTQKRPEEGEKAYQTALKSDLSSLQAALKERCGIIPTVFAYPYGCVSAESYEVLQELGFQAAMTCEEKVNHLTGDPEELYHLGRFNRPSGISTQRFMEKSGIR